MGAMGGAKRAIGGEDDVPKRDDSFIAWILKGHKNGNKREAVIATQRVLISGCSIFIICVV